MVGFVKKENKAASKILVERFIRKAELLDAGVLQGMMERGKLKTINRADRSSWMPGSPASSASSGPSPQHARLQPYNMHTSPAHSPTQLHHHPNQQQYVPPDQLLGQNNTVMELPGDYYHAQPSPGLLRPDHHLSTTSDGSASPNLPGARWSQASNDHQSLSSTRPSSYAPSDNLRSSGLDQKVFTAELPTMEETREEHSQRKQLENQRGACEHKYVYNPQDHAQQAHYAVPPQYSAYNSQGQ